MYDVMVFDHRLAEHRPLDSKSELARLLFGYTTGNGQTFPAQPDLVRFVARPGAERDLQDAMTGRDAIALAEGGEAVQFVYRAEGRRTEGTLARIGNGELRVR
jgi:hypothetical protein